MIKIFLTLLLILPVSAYAGGLDDAMSQSVAGMKVQGARIKVIAQNIANADSTGDTPGALPYVRKTINFKNKFDKNTGIEVVTVDKIGKDNKSEFSARFDPSHPAANSEGYVLLPNVAKSIEMVDMKEAQRSYEANLGAVKTTKKMMMSTLELLR